MNSVESYILDQPKPQQQIMLWLHDMMMSLPDVTCKIRFKIPFYYRKSWICYLNPVKGNGVEFAFLRGNELSNAQGLLEAKDRKQVSGVTFYEVTEIPQNMLREVVMEALILDDEVPYKSKRRKS